MANIVISELRPAGAEFFDGSESFMSDLTDTELDITKGGISPLVVLAIVAIVAITTD